MPGALHRRAAGNQENHIIRHQAENGIDVAAAAGRVPRRNQLADLPLIIHHNPQYLLASIR